jgi:hypothetical protein
VSTLVSHIGALATGNMLMFLWTLTRCRPVVDTCRRTELRGRVLNTCVPCSGGPGFTSWSQRPAILIEVFQGFPQSLQANALKLYHDRFLPNPFQFITIDLAPYHRRYVVKLLKRRRKINCQRTNGVYTRQEQEYRRLRQYCKTSICATQSARRKSWHAFRNDSPFS